MTISITSLSIFRVQKELIHGFDTKANTTPNPRQSIDLVLGNVTRLGQRSNSLLHLYFVGLPKPGIPHVAFLSSLRS